MCKIANVFNRLFTKLFIYEFFLNIYELFNFVRQNYLNCNPLHPNSYTNRHQKYLTRKRVYELGRTYDRTFLFHDSNFQYVTHDQDLFVRKFVHYGTGTCLKKPREDLCCVIW